MRETLLPDLTTDAKAAADVLHEAAELNREDPLREGSLLRFGSAGQLVMTGDMHGALRNFDKLKRYCDLKRNPGRSVILHELIHAEPQLPAGVDLSIDLLVQAAAWKVEFPDNVFFLQSNHELSQLRHHEITKGGRSVLADFERGVVFRYDAHADDVLAGVDAYIASLPLAARTAKGIFLSHSLPDGMGVAEFDLSVFERQLTVEDMDPGGPAYDLVWGRFQRPEEIDVLAERLGVELFVVGHMPQDEGQGVTGRMLIIASDHNQGVFLPIDLNKSYDIERLAAATRKFVAVE